MEFELKKCRLLFKTMENTNIFYKYSINISKNIQLKTQTFHKYS